MCFASSSFCLYLSKEELHSKLSQLSMGSDFDRLAPVNLVKISIISFNSYILV